MNTAIDPSGQQDSAPTIWLLSGDIMSQLGGGFRQQRWCEYFLDLGHSIRLFYVRGAFGVAWEDVSTSAELAAKRARWIAAAPPKAGVRDSPAARTARWIKHSFMIDLFLPSTFQLLFNLHRLKRNVPGRVVLLCSSPPFAMGLVGRLMKAIWGSSIVMVLDMRDLWALHSAFPGFRFQKQPVERWVVRGADIFTTVSNGLAERFLAAHKAKAIVAYNVATHIKPVAKEDMRTFAWPNLDAKLRAQSIKLVYTGSIPEGFYDLELLLDACQIYCNSEMDAPERLQFVFIGAGGELATRAARRKLPQDFLVFLPQMSHDGIAQAQTAADVLLFLGYRAGDNQGQVSIKLFEYFKRRLPILPTAIKAGSDVDDLLSLYCDRTLRIDDAHALASTLEQIAHRNFDMLPQSNIIDRDCELLKIYAETARRVLRTKNELVG